MDTNSVIADNILRLRLKNQMSQEDVAASLQTMGINYTRGRISMVETKRRPPSVQLLIGLKLVFDCEYTDFFGELEAELKKNLRVVRRKSKPQ